MTENETLVAALRAWIDANELRHRDAADRLTAANPKEKPLGVNSVTRWLTGERPIAKWWRPVVRSVCAEFLSPAGPDTDASALTDPNQTYSGRRPARPVQTTAVPPAEARIDNSAELRDYLKTRGLKLGMNFDQMTDVPGYENRQVFAGLLDGQPRYWYWLPEKLAHMLRHLRISHLVYDLPISEIEKDLLSGVVIDTETATHMHRLIPVLEFGDLTAAPLDELLDRKAAEGAAVAVTTDGRYLCVRAADDALAPACPAGGIMLCRRMPLEPNGVYLLRNGDAVELAQFLDCSAATACRFRRLSGVGTMTIDPKALTWYLRAVQFRLADDIVQIVSDAEAENAPE